MAWNSLYFASLSDFTILVVRVSFFSFLGECFWRLWMDGKRGGNLGKEYIGWVLGERFMIDTMEKFELIEGSVLRHWR